MKVEDFLSILLKIAKETPTKYNGGGVGQHSGDYFLFDCGGLIKSVIWGFNFDYSQYRGGAKYPKYPNKINGVADLGCNDLFDTYCYDVSSDFSNIQDGELVVMNGHIGVYWQKHVIESTLAWDSKVLISDIDINGKRSYKGIQVLNWEKHGKANFLKYPLLYKIDDTVILNGYAHKSSEKNSGDSGYFTNYISKIINIKDGEYPYELENIGYVREQYIKSCVIVCNKEKTCEDKTKSKILEFISNIIDRIINYESKK